MMTCQVFYARETDGTRQSSAARRNGIRTALKGVLETHGLHGEVFVRLLHESEMALAHTVPRLKAETKRKVNIVKCVGKHHQALLTEICGVIDQADYDVVHADMDRDAAGLDINVFYIQHKNGRLLPPYLYPLP